MTYSLIAIVALLVANAFFVAAEFALVKVRGFQLEHAHSEGRRTAALSLRMLKNMDAYLATCQLGITMASLGLGWVGEPAVAAMLEPMLSKIGIEGKSLHTISFIVGFLIFSSLHIVVGEQVPKTYAIRKPQPVTLALAYPLEFFYRISFPLTWLLEKANAGILKLFGIRGGSHHEVITEDEISAIVDDSQAHGEIEEKTADIIRKAFLFDDQIVKDIMVRWNKVDKLNLANDAEFNKKVMLENMHTRFPVIDENEEVIGVLTTKDLSAAILKGDTKVFSQLDKHLRTPLFVPGSLLINRLLETMRLKRIHIAIVVDEYGSNIGIITLEDMLEEIIGEIDDEWDIDSVSLKPLKEKTDSGWIANGSLPLSEVEEIIGNVIEDSDNFSTLGGMIMERLERLPKVNDSFVEHGYNFTVNKMLNNSVKSVIISKQKMLNTDSKEQ